MYEREGTGEGPEDFAAIDARRGELADAMEHIGRRLDEQALAPDPTRTDWADVDAHVQATWAEIAKFVDDAQAATGNLTPDEARAVHTSAAQYAMEAAILLELSGDRKSAAEAHRKAAAIAPEGPIREEALAAAKDSAAFAQIAHARFLQRHGDHRGAARVFKAIRTSEPALGRALDELRNAPQPLSSAPTLSTINGIGMGMYGSRDEGPDGTYVSTHCFCVLFVPLIPLSAYRVHRNGDHFTFYAKVPLSGFAKWWRRLLGFGIVAAIVAGLATSWWNQPERQLARALEEVEAEQDVDARIAAYEQLLAEYRFSAPNEATELQTTIVELLVGRVAEPMTADRTATVDGVVARWRALDARPGSPASVTLAQAIDRWAGQLDASTLEGAEAVAHLRALRPELLSGQGREEAEVAARSAGLAVAANLRAEWPVAAFRRFAELFDVPDAVQHADALVDTFEEPILLLELEPLLTRWADHSGSEVSVAALQSRLAEARVQEADPERRAALESADIEALQAQLARFPSDAELQAAVADAKRGLGDAPGALAVFGEAAPGTLASVAQIALAHALREAGELERADVLLDRLVAERLPAYLRAARAYDTEVEALLARLDSRELPYALSSRLQMAGSQEEAQAMYREYVTEQIAQDQELVRLRDRASNLSDVIPLTIEHAMVKLARAEGETGEGREALLRDAERVFLSVRQQAEGSPDYHLGLGQVYHRLGRPEEGDAELQVAMAQGPQMQMAAAHTYRELGLGERAQQVAQQVWDGPGPADVKTSAAILMSLLAVDPEEEETWLLRAPQDLVFVRNGLDALRAQRAVDEGRLDEAERLYTQIAERWETEAETDRDGASSNNAALAYMQLYTVNGDPSALRRAVRLLEDALRRSPESALTIANLANVHEMAGYVAVLGRWVRPGELRIDTHEASSLVHWLRRGPLRAEVDRALDAERSVQRAADLNAQAMLLAPNMGSGFEGALSHARRKDDMARAQQIAEAVVRHSYEDARARRAWDEYLRGENSALEEQKTDSGLALRRRVVENTRQPATKAVAHAMLAELLMSAGSRRRDANMLDEAITQYRAAQAAWNGLDVRRDLGWALITRAVLDRRAADPAFDRAYTENERRLTVDLSLLEMASDGPLTELANHPRTREALTLMKAWSGVETYEPDLALWTIGKALGDGELQALHRDAFDSPIDQTIAAARAHLRPWDERRAKRVAIYRGGPG